jgi:hypothetical protein
VRHRENQWVAPPLISGNMLMKRIVLALALVGGFCSVAPAQARLEEDWLNPPPEARLRAYWWWINGNVTRESPVTWSR